MKKYLFSTLTACMLAACGSHDFSKGDNVIVAENLSIRHYGYCEGTVVSEKDNDVIVKISKCKNNGVQGADIGGMTAFDKSQVYKPENGLPMVQARKKLSMSTFMNSKRGKWNEGMLLPTHYKYIDISNFDQLIKYAKQGKLPVTQSWLIAMKPALTMVKEPEFNYGSKVPKYTNEPVWNKLIKFMNNEPELVRNFAETIHDHSNNALLENFLATDLYSTIKASADNYVQITFDPKHPEEWKKLEARVLKARSQLYSSLNSLYTKYKLSSEAVRNDIKEQTNAPDIDTLTSKLIRKYALDVFRDKAATSSDYKTLTVSLKKELSAQFPSNTNMAFKAIDAKGKQIFERQKKIHSNFVKLSKGKYWHITLHDSYHNFDVQMRFTKTDQGYQAKMNDTPNKSKFVTLDVDITPQNVTISTANYLDGNDVTITRDELEKGKFKHNVGTGYSPVIIAGMRD